MHKITKTVIFLFIAILIASYYLTNHGKVPPPSQEAPLVKLPPEPPYNPTPPPKKVRQELHIGDIAILDSKAGQKVIAAVHLYDLERYIEFKMAADKTGMQQLEKQGLVEKLPDGLKCKIIKLGDPFSEVRLIATGKPIHLTCYVPRVYLRSKDDLD